jgi:Holliday junction resolvase-like predicted endonuclease
MRQFFTDGTGLKTLSESYVETQVKLQEIDLVLYKQKEMIEAVDLSIGKYTSAVKAAEAITEQKKAVKLLNNELAWAYVTRKERVSAWCEASGIRLIGRRMYGT